MLTLGPLAFAHPWLLMALAGLPGLYWLLRLTPPAPKSVHFPPLRLLLQLVTREETPARTPLWLLLLRIAVAMLVILSVARPVLNPAPALEGSGPVVIVLDDGWAAASHWNQRISTLDTVLVQAERDNREIVLVRSAPGENGIAVQRFDAITARESLVGLEPRPWPVDRAATGQAIAELALHEATSIWLTDGLVAGEATPGPAIQLAEQLGQLGSLTIVTPADGERAILLDIPEPQSQGLLLSVERAGSEGERPVSLNAIGPDGEVLARVRESIPDGDRQLDMQLDLPAELLGHVARIEITGEESAGATVLFDERWRRRSVGIAAPSQSSVAQPLLAESYYLSRALSPFATVREGSVEELLDQPISLLVLTDQKQIESHARSLLDPWMKAGGVVLRFAGPRLADGDDDFVPVPLRHGDRSLGGALSWSTPLMMAPIPADSPLAGIDISDEVTVTQQVLAQPSAELAGATLASLEDGTPLITGKRIGAGWLILVHTTANTAWTNLPLSSVFIDILRQILAMAPGAGGLQSGLMRIDQVLDGFGRLVDAKVDIERIDGRDFAGQVAGPLTPPGLWAPADSLETTNEHARVALNIQTAIHGIEPMDLRDLATHSRRYDAAQETDLLPWLLGISLLLAMVDLAISYVFRGILPEPARMSRTASIALGVAVVLASAPSVQAQEDDTAKLTSMTRLAYVRTGLRDVDDMSRAGLVGLGLVLEQRTTIETGDPVAVDLYSDDLALFPLVYWPISPEHPRIPGEAITHLDDYMHHGGLVLIDTGDAARMLPGQTAAGPGELRLQTILHDLDIPPLEPVPQDHVLTRSFYLLQDFPGRFTGRPVWVDQTPSGINDGVASMIVGSNDWAGAWATDEYGRSLLPVVPGGERQREMARRFGVNVVMYALTGNYKTDQVHVPALLERLGQ